MEKALGLFIAILATLMMWARASADTSETKAADAAYGTLSNGFALSLSPTDDVYHAGGPLRITLRLKNKGPDVIVKWDWPGFYDFTMFDSNGLLVQPVVTKADIFITGRYADIFSHGQVNQHTFDLSGRYQLAPGDYSIRASRKLYDPGKFGTDPREWKLIAEPISNELMIHISPAP